MVHGGVDRYEAANVRALNFVLHGALGGGGPRSLAPTTWGKPWAAHWSDSRSTCRHAGQTAADARPDVSWADTILRSRPQS